MGRGRGRWSEPSRGSYARLRSRQPRTPAEVLAYAQHLATQLRSHEEPHGGLDRTQLAVCSSCCRMLLGLLDVRHALKTDQADLPGQAAEGLREMLAASAQLAHQVMTPSALRAICALVHIRFPPWEEPSTDTERGPIAKPRPQWRMGYTPVPGAPVWLSEQEWDESGSTKPNAPPPQLIADPGWHDYPPEEDNSSVVPCDTRDPRSPALRNAQHEGIKLLLVLCGYGCGRDILHATHIAPQPHLLEQLCELSRSVPWRWVLRSAPERGVVAVWEDFYPADEHRGRLQCGCDALLLLGALAGLPGVEPIDAIAEAFFCMWQGFEACLLARPADTTNSRLSKWVARRGCAAVAALHAFSRAHATMIRQLACAPDVPIVHMLLRVVYCATLEPTASIPFQVEAAGLVLPALQILEEIGRVCPTRLVSEAFPDGCAQLVRLMDEAAFASAAAASASESSHCDAGWRRTVGHAASRVMMHLLVYDSPSGEALLQLLLSTVDADAPASTTVDHAAAASRGEGGGRTSCAAHVVWRALLYEHVDTRPLLKVICDSGMQQF